MKNCMNRCQKAWLIENKKSILLKIQSYLDCVTVSTSASHTVGSDFNSQYEGRVWKTLYEVKYPCMDASPPK